MKIVMQRDKRTVERAARIQEAARKAEQQRRRKMYIAGALYVVLLAVFFWPSSQGTLFQRVSAKVRGEGLLPNMNAPLAFAEASAKMRDPVRKTIEQLAEHGALERQEFATGRLLTDPERDMKLALLAAADTAQMRARWRGDNWVKVELPAGGGAEDPDYGVQKPPEVTLRVRMVKGEMGWICEDIKILKKKQ